MDKNSKSINLIDFKQSILDIRDLKKRQGIEKIQNFSIVEKIGQAIYHLWRLFDGLKNDKSMQKLIHSDRQFDLVLVEPYCDIVLGLGHHFNVPIISIAPNVMVFQSIHFSATPGLKSFMPDLLVNYIDKMNFWQRLKNQSIHILMACFREINYSKQKWYEMFYSNSTNLPSFKEIQRNISLTLVNSYPTLEASWPFMPNIIQVGGIGIVTMDEPPLPPDIQQFLDYANTSVVYFSFGSIVDISLLSPNLVNAIFDSFQELTHIKFLVKGNDNLQALYRNNLNIMVRSWLPQTTILKHPNVKCFISHGGHNGVQESIFYGKPKIIIPFFYDQLLNAQWAYEKGYGIEISHAQLTRANLKSAIENIISDSRLVETTIFLAGLDSFIRCWDFQLYAPSTNCFQRIPRSSSDTDGDSTFLD